MNNSIFKKLPVALIAAAFLLSFTTVADKTNFSGSWKLNEGKSELGQFGRFATRKVKVEQKDDAINVSKTTPSFNGGEDVTTTETLTFDGKTSESTVFGNSKKKSTAKWSDDGKTLTVNFTIAIDRNGDTMEITGSETWSLTDDGKLSLVNTSVSPQGERTTKAIYDKE